MFCSCGGCIAVRLLNARGIGPEPGDSPGIKARYEALRWQPAEPETPEVETDG